MSHAPDDIGPEPHDDFTIGFLINPIAGMGGRVGLKGTDDVVERARELGAVPTAHLRARDTLDVLASLLKTSGTGVELSWVTCSGPMGEEVLRDAGIVECSVVYRPSGETSRTDTRNAIRGFMDRGADLILFCGGDGTARDIGAIVGTAVPILGIPAGVKMYSGVFGISPARVAETVYAFAQGELQTSEVEILDLDEDRYRRNEWAVRLYQTAVTPFEPNRVQASKMLISEIGEEDSRAEIASYISDLISVEPETLFLLGPGSTVKAVAEAIGQEKTLLGIDAYLGGAHVAGDLNETGILSLLDKHPRCKLVLSPIGAQGFILGRGNLQLSPQIVRAVGRDNLVVIATTAKLARTPKLRIDTGDSQLDLEIVGNGHLPVIVGDRRRRLVRIAV
jgi:predicted polyphosphate/ATP-dependent NAD kinase